MKLNLIDLYTKTQDELAYYVEEFLMENEYKVHHVEGSFILGIPKAHETDRVILVSHLDVSGDRYPKRKEIIEFAKDEVKALGYKGKTIKLKKHVKDKILGADDRNGVYAMLKLIERGYNPGMIFTYDEEKGCLGADGFVRTLGHKENKEALNYLNENFNMMIEIDRGSGGGNRKLSQVVYYEEENEDLKDFMADFKFHADWGSVSDIVQLSEVLDMASCNVSAGYAYEHTNKEVCLYDELLNTIDKIEMIMKRVAKENVYFEKERMPMNKLYGKGDHYLGMPYGPSDENEIDDFLMSLPFEIKQEIYDEYMYSTSNYYNERYYDGRY